MANPQIGSLTFVSLAGPIPTPIGYQVEDVSAPGRDGHEFRIGPKRSAPFRMISTVDIAAANLATVAQSYAAAKGSKVTVKDNVGTDWTNVVVLDVRLLPAVPMLAGVGGINAGSNMILQAEWTLQVALEVSGS